MLEDRVLLRKSRNGDRQAFEVIYEKYRDDLLTIAVHLLRDKALAEDAVQEVFVKLIESLDTFELRGSLKGFLSCCTANRCRDILRRQKVRVASELYDNVIYDPNPEPIAVLVRSEEDAKLAAGLGELPYEQREVIILRHHGGMRFRRIAEVQGTSTKTVQSRYSYGMQKLRTLLNGEAVQ